MPNNLVNTTDAGPATRTAVTDVPPIGNQGIEAHLTNGVNSLGPASAPYIDPRANNYGIDGRPATAINTSQPFGLFVNPA